MRIVGVAWFRAQTTGFITLDKGLERGVQRPLLVIVCLSVCLPSAGSYCTVNQSIVSWRRVLSITLKVANKCETREPYVEKLSYNKLHMNTVIEQCSLFILFPKMVRRKVQLD
ncbi:hypothetical protein J6590_007651 [Homalodisca vitripennis]|nr:hypothetical protein J6590_007651 [Homalodisca vitripennis]